MSRGSYGPGIRAVKKTAALALCLAALMSPGVSGSESGERLRVEFIHNNPCVSCQEDKKFADMVREQFSEEGAGFHYDIIAYYAYSEEGREKVEEFQEKFGVSDKERLYPLVAVGEECLIGRSAVEEGIRELMEKTWEQESSEAEEEQTFKRWPSWFRGRQKLKVWYV